MISNKDRKEFLEAEERDRQREEDKAEAMSKDPQARTPLISGLGFRRVDGKWIADGE